MELVRELQDLRCETDEATAAVEEVAAGLTDEQLRRRPDERSWSISDNLVHLRLTVDGSVPNIEKCVADARARNLFSNGPFNIGLKGRLFVWYVEPPPKLRLPAPKTLVPPLSSSGVEALERFREGQRLMLAKMEDANGIDLVRANYQSPFASFVRMNLLTLLRVFTAHERRHILQMSNVRRAVLGS